MNPLWIVLIVIGALLVLILLAFFLGHAKIRIVSKPKKTRIVLKILGIGIPLLTRKEKERRQIDLSRCRNPEAALRRELKRQRREAEKEARRRLKAEKKAAAKKAKKAEAKRRRQMVGGVPVKTNIKEKLAMLLRLTKRVYAITNGKSKVKIKKLKLTVGSEHAAKTVMLRQLSLQSVAALLNFLDRYFIRVKYRPDAISVEPNFLSEESHYEIDLTFSIRLSRAAFTASALLRAWKEEERRALKKAYRRMQEAREAEQSN